MLQTFTGIFTDYNSNISTSLFYYYTCSACKNCTSQHDYHWDYFFVPKRITRQTNKEAWVLPGKNPGENLWNDTDITFEVKEKASSTPANNTFSRKQWICYT